MTSRHSAALPLRRKHVSAHWTGFSAGHTLEGRAASICSARKSRGNAFSRIICVLGFLLVAADADAQICSSRHAVANAPVRQLYVIAGQSNAVGLASVIDIVGGKNDVARAGTAYRNVKIYGIYGAPTGVAGKDEGRLSKDVHWSDFAKWHVASAGFGYKNLNGQADLFPFGTRSVDLFGAELAMARLLNTRPPHDHYIAKLAVSNTSLIYPNAVDSWAPAGHLYSELLKVVAGAQNSAPRTVRLRVAGVFFMQGETDALHEWSAKAYKKNLKDFIESFRRDLKRLGCSDDIFVPVVVGRIQDNQSWVYRNHVRSAQQDVTRMLPNVGLVDTDDLAKHLSGGGLHFNEYAQSLLGERVYNSFVTLASTGGAVKMIRKDFYPPKNLSVNGDFWRSYWCGSGVGVGRIFEKRFPWTHKYDGLCRAYQHAPLY